MSQLWHSLPLFQSLRILIPFPSRLKSFPSAIDLEFLKDPTHRASLVSLTARTVFGPYC